MNSTAMDWQARTREQFESMLLNITLAWKAEQEKQVGLIQAGSREQFASGLNLGLRRLRAVKTTEEVAALTVELAGGFAEKAAFFLFRDGRARAEASRNLGAGVLEFPPNEAAAFQTAIETQDPVVAMGTAPEISAVLAERVGIEDAPRVFLYPLAVRGEVQAVLLAAGNVEAGSLELIAGMAALQLEAITPAAAAPSHLVSIAGMHRVEPTLEKDKAAAKAWDLLTPEQQSLHLRAQRKARLRVAEMQIEHRQALQRGRGKADLYSELRTPIDAAREEFRREFLTSSPTMVDYLYLEMVRGLAQGQEHLLGASFPGPLI